ncbi:TetR/AcrR family transcriptional regulator [Cohnella zeiphila]|uniref:TetR/AcrR family transcriptional regulator n=1 Tax=Cohnella zeiphila TaxID=2761120 RepID=A0A7X0SIN3_9BACL|nr:TetR/AcrR family transcriptional regulator [Cohnella zeiphila]MBB6730586.1 TetR/AcrR family transcriptional regulator [Cohnella zeiphila]
MSRPREFDVDQALRQSMEVFWTKGFKSTSYEDLTRTTQVKKQSLYCVFKDKRDLFLKALALYREQSVAMLEELASREVSPLKKLEAVCDSTLYQNEETLRRGCLMVNSALEFGEDDREVNREVTLMFDQTERILEKIIREGQEQELVTNRRSGKELAAYLNNALSGAKLMEKSGASPEQIAAVLHTSVALMVSENAR